MVFLHYFRDAPIQNGGLQRFWISTQNKGRYHSSSLKSRHVLDWGVTTIFCAPFVLTLYALQNEVLHDRGRYIYIYRRLALVNIGWGAKPQLCQKVFQKTPNTSVRIAFDNSVSFKTYSCFGKGGGDLWDTLYYVSVNSTIAPGISVWF